MKISHTSAGSTTPKYLYLRPWKKTKTCDGSISIFGMRVKPCSHQV